MPGENIAQHLTECAEFIDRALSMRCGMVFIASYMGKINKYVKNVCIRICIINHDGSSIYVGENIIYNDRYTY